jgi:hypothetical protein
MAKWLLVAQGLGEKRIEKKFTGHIQLTCTAWAGFASNDEHVQSVWVEEQRYLNPQKNMTKHHIVSFLYHRNA